MKETVSARCSEAKTIVIEAKTIVIAGLTRNLPINRHSDESQNPLMQRGVAGQARNDGVKRGMTGKHYIN
jgi:hypothetical protein